MSEVYKKLMRIRKQDAISAGDKVKEMLAAEFQEYNLEARQLSLQGVTVACLWWRASSIAVESNSSITHGSGILRLADMIQKYFAFRPKLPEFTEDPARRETTTGDVLLAESGVALVAPVGTVWRHIGSCDPYVIVTIATIEATMKPAVIYRPLNSGADALMFIRPAAEFLEKFERADE